MISLLFCVINSAYKNLAVNFKASALALNGSGKDSNNGSLGSRFTLQSFCTPASWLIAKRIFTTIGAIEQRIFATTVKSPKNKRRQNPTRSA